MKIKKAIIWAISIIIICVIAIVLTQPILVKAIFAKYKSTEHFLILQEDPRIKYEESAKKKAQALSPALDDSKNAVESVLKANFNKPIKVYVCATQESFNEYVYLSKNVRGAVYWGKLFLSPGAFNRGSLLNLTSHELTHYLFYTHLGERASIKGIPLWFREGIAEFVANGGAKYTAGKDVLKLMSNEEKEVYLSGNINFWFFTQNPADAVTEKGVVNWLLYRVGALLVHFMHDSKPEKFDTLIQLLLSGTGFNEALQITYDQDTESLLQEFTRYLTQRTLK